MFLVGNQCAGNANFSVLVKLVFRYTTVYQTHVRYKLLWQEISYHNIHYVIIGKFIKELKFWKNVPFQL